MTGIQAGQGGSIDIGYKPYDGSASAAVWNAAAAPIPENTNLAYNWGDNAHGYRTLSQARTTVNGIAIATGVVSGGFACLAYCAEVGTAILNLQATAQASANAQVLRIMAFLESKGIPATVAAKMALKAMSRMGTQPSIKAKIQFGRELVQKLNQVVREYQSQGAH